MVNKLRVFDGFAGYGGASFAIKKAGIEHEVVAWSEINKYACQCFEQNHCHVGDKGTIEPKNYGDMTKINPLDLPDFDLLCASPPCQAFSIAGKGLGKEDSRGRLFENTIEIMKIKQPRYAIYENVKGLTFKKHKEYFEYILNLMKEAGYYVTWKVLNTKDYGIPQNRQRVFIICFKNKEDLERFTFPEKEELKIVLKDVLDEEVDEKYNLSQKMIQGIKRFKYLERKSQDINGICGTLRVGGDIKCIKWNIKENGDNSQQNRAYLVGGISPCLDTNSKPIFTNSEQDPVETWRRLTPKECFRLQGFKDEEINLNNLSDTRIYKLAGNGLSINVVTKIFKEMFK